MKDNVENKVDMTKLESGLNSLRGRDFAAAERDARRMGETMPMIQFSGTFQANLAAKALGIAQSEMDDMPINEYVTVITKVSNFLFSDMAPETVSASASKNTTR